MAHSAIASDRFTSSPVDDGAAAVAAIVTARREAWERARARGASHRSYATLRDVAVTAGPEMGATERINLRAAAMQLVDRRGRNLVEAL
jgi:hypothetical protein